MTHSKEYERAFRKTWRVKQDSRCFRCGGHIPAGTTVFSWSLPTAVDNAKPAYAPIHEDCLDELLEEAESDHVAGSYADVDIDGEIAEF